MTQSSRQPTRPRLGITVSLIDRYIIREFLIGYLIALAVVLSLRILLDLFAQFDEFAEASEAVDDGVVIVEVALAVGRYYGPRLFEYFRDFSGTMILLAAAFSLVRMKRYNELTGVLASGVSLKRLIAPIVIMAAVLNLLMVMDQEWAIPRLADRLVLQHDEMVEIKHPPIWLVPDRDNALFTAISFDPEQQRVEHLTVLLRDKGRMIGWLQADSATWNGTDGWDLHNARHSGVVGAQSRGADAPTDDSTVQFYPSSLTPESLWLERHSEFKRYMSRHDLGRLLRRLTPGSVEYAATISEIHFRFTDPITNMVMLLLSLPLLVSRPVGVDRFAMMLAILGSGACFITSFACKLLAGEPFVAANALGPLLVAWLPIIIFLPISILILDGMKT